MDPLADEHNRIAIAPNVKVSAKVLRFTFTRSGGPGGQHVNKVATQAILTVDVDDLAQVLPASVIARLQRKASAYLARDRRLVISASTSRSQLANRKACLAKLRHLIVAAMHKPATRKPTRPSRASIQRRLNEKKARGLRKRAREEDRRPPVE